MLRSTRFATLALVLVAGCPSNETPMSDPEPLAGAGGAGGGAGGEDAQVPAAMEDAAVAPDTVEELVLDEGEFTVGAGEEVSYCMRLPMPERFRGRDLALVGWDSDVPPPTHHYFMTYTPDGLEGDEPQPCQGDSGVLPQSMSGEAFATSGVLNTKILFAVGVGMTQYQTDRGYGAVIEADGSFVTNHHVLNVTEAPVNMHGRFTLKVKDAALVPHPVRNLVCSTAVISVPAGETSSVTATCLAPFPLDVVIMAGHAHARMTSFYTRFYDGEATVPDVIYESHDWDNPEMKTFETPLHLEAGQGLTFTCEYSNTGETDIAFGFNAQDEMCALFSGYAYPPDRTFEIPPPLFGVALLSNAVPFTVSDSTDSPFFF
jgi:hypothetical protein